MMKKLVPLFLLLTIAGFAKGQGKTVPPAVESAFGKQYAGIQATGWSEEDGIWESRFEQSGVEADAQYTSQGQWIKTKFNLPTDQLPAQLLKSLNQHYAHYQLEQVVMHEAPGQGRNYEVDINAEGNDIQMLMDESGKIIGTEVEKSNDE